MKKRGAAVCCAGLAALACTLAGCSLFQTPKADGMSPSSHAVQQGTAATREDYFAAQETPSTYERRLYADAVSDGYTGSYEEFLEELGLYSSSAGVSAALMASVSVTAEFSASFPFQPSQKVYGSGVIWSLDGAAGSAYIITSCRTVLTVTENFGRLELNDADSIAVAFYGSSETYSAELVLPAAGEDATVYLESDIAVLYLENCPALRTQTDGAESTEGDGTKTPAVRQAARAESVSAGERAYAVGNATGSGISATGGNVSAIEAEYAFAAANSSVWGTNAVTVKAVKTDAGVNDGNIGGGLFNEKGELLGIVLGREDTASGTEVRSAGYALPIQKVSEVLQELNVTDGSQEAGGNV